VTDPNVADTVAVTGFVTDVVVTENEALDEPAGKITIVGAVADRLLLLRETTVRTGAVPDKATTPVALVPPTTLAGSNVRPTRVIGRTVSVAVFETEPKDAFRVAFIALAALRVAIPNVPLTAPLGMVTDAGTRAHGLLLPSKTLMPFVGAGLPSVTVPVELVPPSTDAGDTLI